jgi:hypothetical protein
MSNTFYKFTNLKDLSADEAERLKKLLDEEMALKRLADTVLTPLNDRARDLQKQIDEFWTDTFKERGIDYDRLDSGNPVFEIQKKDGAYKIFLRNYS